MILNFQKLPHWLCQPINSIEENIQMKFNHKQSSKDKNKPKNNKPRNNLTWNSQSLGQSEVLFTNFTYNLSIVLLISQTKSEKHLDYSASKVFLTWSRRNLSRFFFMNHNLNSKWKWFLMVKFPNITERKTPKIAHINLFIIVGWIHLRIVFIFSLAITAQRVGKTHPENGHLKDHMTWNRKQWPNKYKK